MKSFDVNGVNNGTRNLASSYDGVFIAERMVEEKNINLSLAYAPYPYHIICQDESYKGAGGCNQPL